MKKYKSQFFSTRFNRYKIPVKPPYKFLSITLNFYMKFCMNESMNRKIKNYVCTDFFDPTILLLKLFPKVIIERFRKNFLHKVVQGSII